MANKQSIPLRLAIPVILLAAVIVGAVVYFLQQQSFQAALQIKTDRIEQLEVEATRLKAESSLLESMKGEQRVVIQNEADKILFALKNKDMAALSGYVHPQKGLRFTPYSYINTATDRLFMVSEIPDLFSGTTRYHWGSYDGSGEPMDLTFTDYCAKFVYDKDFLAAPQIVYNQVLQRGNSINNIEEVYPQGVSLEYHFSGFVAEYEGMDWESLKLVFEQEETSSGQQSDAKWYLVGIIHEQWTI